MWTYCELCDHIYVFALSLHWLDMEFCSKTYNVPDLGGCNMYRALIFCGGGGKGGNGNPYVHVYATC